MQSSEIAVGFCVVISSFRRSVSYFLFWHDFFVFFDFHPQKVNCNWVETCTFDENERNINWIEFEKRKLFNLDKHWKITIRNKKIDQLKSRNLLRETYIYIAHVRKSSNRKIVYFCLFALHNINNRPYLVCRLHLLKFSILFVLHRVFVFRFQFFGDVWAFNILARRHSLALSYIQSIFRECVRAFGTR